MTHLTTSRGGPWAVLPFLLLLLLLLLAGCGGNSAYRQGMDMMATGRQDEGLAKLAQANREAPDDPVISMSYQNARKRVASRVLGEAQAERNAGHLDSAAALYQRVLQFDASNAEAAAGLSAIEQGRIHAQLMAEARGQLATSDYEGASRKVAQVLQENPGNSEARALRQQIDEKARRDQVYTPTLRKTFQKPVSLEFRDASLKQVLEVLSAHSGLNFILDKDVPTTLTVTVFLHNVSIVDALDLILVTNQLKQRVLNDNSLLIYPDSTNKQGDHQELVVRNFFLANAEAKQVATMLKTVLKARNVYADDKLNLLIMRDSPTMIQLAERLINTQDVAEPEVMLEVAVVEVTRSLLNNLGIQFPTQLTLTPLASSGSTVTLRDLRNLNSGSIGAAISSLIFNLQNDPTSTNLLANPRIRTHNREKALIRIGDRVPVITTTATSTGFVSENVQYVDVGLKLEVEPVIFPNDEISIKLALEVSSVTKEVTSKAGSLSYQIGGRNASTVLRLKDGETQVLGGLINDDDRRSANNFPGLSQLPILGRLFSNQKDNFTKSELILSITPRIVRNLQAPVDVPRAFWSGTENDPRLRQDAPREERPDERSAATMPLMQPAVSTVSGVPGASVAAEVPVAPVQPTTPAAPLTPTPVQPPAGEGMPPVEVPGAKP